MKVKIKVLMLLFALGVVLTTAPSFAKDYSEANKTTRIASSAYQDALTGEISWIGINNIATVFKRNGKSANVPATGASGGYFPRGQVTVIYEDGLVWGGLVRDGNTPAKRVGGSTYITGTVPGWINADGTPEPWENNPAVRIYRIRNDYKTVSNASLTQDASEMFSVPVSAVTEDMFAAIRDAYAKDWKEWPVSHGAPYYDIDGDGTYNPVLDSDGYPIAPVYDDNGNLTDGGDYPGIAGADQVLWWAVNDFDDVISRSIYGSPSTGLEIRTTVFGYARTDELGDVYFKKYDIKNYSGATIDSMYLAQWSDPDVGDYANDFTGCDTTLSIMFAYNGIPSDAAFSAFGIAPAAVGYDFLQGPIVPSPGDTAIWDLKKLPNYKNLPMTSYSFFSAGSGISDPALGDYSGTKEWYNMLRGYIPTNSDEPTAPYVDENDNPTKYPLAGDPVTRSGDIDGANNKFGPGDRRMVMTAGPFTMADGGEQQLVVGVLGGLSKDYRQSVAKLKFTDQFVQLTYDNLFSVAKAPASPSVRLIPTGKKIVIDWGWDAAAVKATEKTINSGYAFEGYSVYQVSPTGENKKIANFDVANGITLIMAPKFDDQTGVITEQLIRNGTDSGIQRYLVVDHDYFTEGPLTPGTVYKYVVTAYSYNAQIPVSPSLESQFTVNPVTAQFEKPGDKLSYEPGTELTVTHEKGFSTGYVKAFVIDPSKTIAADYAVTWSDASHFNLVNVSASIGTPDTLIKDYAFVKGELSTTANGVAVEAWGPLAASAADWNYSGSRWVSGTNWGGSLLFGGVDLGANFFGSTLGDADLVDIQTIWQDQADVTANGYASKGQTYRRDQGWPYPAGGIGELPFSAYDMTDPDNPRKVNVCFVEDANNGSANLIWDMGWDGSAFAALGGREYTFFMLSDYNEGADYNDTNWGPASDVVFAMWPSARGSHTYLEAPFTMNFYVSKPMSIDSFTFSTTAPVVGDKELAKSQFDKATVYPNPYYAFNSLETGNFDRFVTITNLPEKVTVKIFNLGGVLVRTLTEADKVSSTDQFLKWDLNNENNLPVASGLYVIHIEAPELGATKILKAYIIQAKQKLKFY